MHPLQLEVRDALTKNNISPSTTLIVGLSGGKDSMVLCHVLQSLKYNLIIAHSNFQLRGTESDGDAAFVKDYCSKNGLQFELATWKMEEELKDSSESVQMGARRLRYAHWKNIQLLHPHAWIVTAHHAADNLETFFIQWIRSNPVQLPSGMPQIDPIQKIFRPMLQSSPELIQSYQEVYHIPFREDSSNATDKYLRNKIRHHILPILLSENPSLFEESAHTIELLQQMQKHIASQCALHHDSFVIKKGPFTHIRIEQLKEQTFGFQLFCKELLSKGFLPKQIQSIWSEYPFGSGAKFFSDAFIGVAYQGKLVVCQRDLQDAFHIEFNSATNSDITLLAGSIHFEPGLNPKLNWSKDRIPLSQDLMVETLTCRSWQPGDKMEPLGMKNQHKKISDILTDAHVPPYLKENYPVVLSGKRIVWVPGICVSEALRLSNQNQVHMILSWSANTFI